MRRPARHKTTIIARTRRPRPPRTSPRTSPSAHTAFTCLEWLLAAGAIALRLPSLRPQVRGGHTELRPEHVALLPEDRRPAKERR
jgi:hypothetical protein